MGWLGDLSARKQTGFAVSPVPSLGGSLEADTQHCIISPRIAGSPLATLDDSGLIVLPRARRFTNFQYDESQPAKATK